MRGRGMGREKRVRSLLDLVQRLPKMERVGRRIRGV
jgi:hypothetical protein